MKTDYLTRQACVNTVISISKREPVSLPPSLLLVGGFAHDTFFWGGGVRIFIRENVKVGLFF